MSIQTSLKGQYHAAMAMLLDAVRKCPDELWTGGGHAVPFWRVAYHALFFTHLYLGVDVKAFRPWERHREEAEQLGPMPWAGNRMPKAVEPYTKAEILEYWRVCDAMVDGCVDAMDLDARECGFPWYRLPKLDHQINNIRHIQHHAAILIGRLKQSGGIDVGWVGFS